jgi:glycosyltransferase involved in cell wall biosynthesis
MFMGRHNMVRKKLGYLSGAPRVSTRPEAGATGSKNHVMGVMRAFESLGWEVRPFIVGDRVPADWIRSGSEQKLRRGMPSRLAADLLRVGMGYWNARHAVRELGQVDWVYERLGAFQQLWRTFKQRGISWILETNAPLFYEAKNERQSMVLSALARRMELRAYRECDVLVCVSRELKEIVTAEARISPDKAVVMPNGVDTTRFDPVKVRKKRFFDLPTLGFVGNLYDWQGLDLLLAGLAELRLESVDFALAVVGDGPMREEWEGIARGLNLGDRVKFTGRVAWEKVPRYINGFDLGYSGQVPLGIGKMYHSPLKLYEYLAMGKPVVASAYDDARRTARRGETGYLFEPRSKESLKNALRRAYTEQQAWPQLGQKARETAVKEHSWQARIHGLIQEVDKILNRHTAHRWGSR